MCGKIKGSVYARYEKAVILLLMVIAYVFLMIGVWNSYPMHTTTDELGVLVGAAHLAGLDWSGVISNSGYYGFGWYSLFFWLFRLTDSPIIIYRTIIIITAFFRVLIIPIAYNILKNHLGVKQEVYLFMLSFLMPFLHTSTVGIISNEYILEFLIWIILLLICKSVTSVNIKKRILYSTLLVGAVAYSLFIHTRALTMLIAVTMVYFIYGTVYKKKQAISIVVGMPVIYVISQKVISIYQAAIYGEQGGALRNATVSVSRFDIFDIKTWEIWFHMIVGIVNTESIITGGMFLAGVATLIFYVRSLIKTKRRVLPVEGNMILSIAVLCIGATIAAFLISNWFRGMFLTWGEPMASAQYAYKGLAYVRYWDIYVPPLIMCTFALLPKLTYKKIICTAMLVITVMHVAYIIWLIPLVKYNGNCAGFLYGVGHYNQEFQVTQDYFLKCIAISLIIAFMAFCVSQTKYRQYALVLFIGFTMLSHYNKQTEYNVSIKKRISSKIMASYEEKLLLDTQGIEIGTIYLNDESTGADNNWKIYSVAQFYFNRYTLKIELPTELKKNDVIISVLESHKIETMYQDINCYILDDNEVWYTYLELN